MPICTCMLVCVGPSAGDFGDHHIQSWWNGDQMSSAADGARSSWAGIEVGLSQVMAVGLAEVRRDVPVAGE